MTYKIYAIYHNGTQGEAWTQKTDENSIKRIGSTIKIERVKRGEPIIGLYLKDNKGVTLHYVRIMRTSLVKDYTCVGKVLIVETENSLYKFVEVSTTPTYDKTLEVRACKSSN